MLSSLTSASSSLFFFSSRRRHTRCLSDWSSDVCSSDLDSLHAALCETVRGAPPERQLALVCAHPDLPGRLARAGGPTPASAREQSAAGLDRLDPSEAAEIGRLNGAYTARFGFPFVICARLNEKETILAAMRSRAGNTPEAELSTALGEIAKIARLRLNEAIAKEN